MGPWYGYGCPFQPMNMATFQGPTALNPQDIEVPGLGSVGWWLLLLLTCFDSPFHGQFELTTNNWDHQHGSEKENRLYMFVLMWCCVILYDLFVGATWMSEHLHVSSALPGSLAQAGCSHGSRANEAPGFFRFWGWGGQQINLNSPRPWGFSPRKIGESPALIPIFWGKPWC